MRQGWITMIEYSRGRSKLDNKPEQRRAEDFNAFCQAVLNDRAAQKGQQYICGPMAIAPNDRTHQSQSSFANAVGSPHRCKQCALRRRWMGLDIDGGLNDTTYLQFRAALMPFNALVYTTASHTAVDHHLRVIVELSLPLERTQLQRASLAFRQQIDDAVAGVTIAWDKACDNAEQPLFLPLHSASHQRFEGKPFAVESFLAEEVAQAEAEPVLIPASPGDLHAMVFMQQEITKLSATPHGQRSNALNKLAYTLGGYVGAGRLDKVHVEAMLLRATAHWPDPQKTARTITASIASGACVPLVNTMSIRSVGAGPENHDTHVTQSPCTDLANAARIRTHYGDRLLYVDGIGWHVFEGPWRHRELAAKQIFFGLSAIVAAEVQELKSSCDQSVSDVEQGGRSAALEARQKWAKKCEQRATIESAIKMAEPLLACGASEMDADPMLVGMPAGVLDLRNCEVRSHQPGDRITRTLSCNYDPDAQCPVFQGFVNQIMGGDAELVDYVQRILGYALSGKRDEQMLPILYGTGANGKSTLVNAIQEIFGDYAATGATGLLTAQNQGGDSGAEADLLGRRLVIVSETGESDRMNEEQVKRLTSREDIKARRLYQNYMQFKPTHLLLLQTNHKPRVAGTDHGIWRRLKLIPFLVTIPEHARDVDLGTKLKSEYPGILRWMVEGWKKYQANGLHTPQRVLDATAEYRSISDQVGMFLSEMCTVGKEQKCTNEQIYFAYERWANDSGERAISKRRFSQQLSERDGITAMRTSAARGWLGVAPAQRVALIPLSVGTTLTLPPRPTSLS